jgi:hypothetical protein
MHTTPGSRELLRKLHNVYHASPDADIHEAIHGPVRTPDRADSGELRLFRDAQPGTAEHTRLHLVGSAAPEPLIEVYGPIGPEDFGPVKILDGRTGRPL